MHDIQFSLAALPEPPAVFRVQLRPYSLGHELHLWRRQNEYLTKTVDEFDALHPALQFRATIQAILVCSRSHAGNCRTARGIASWAFLAQFCSLPKAVRLMREHIVNGANTFKSELPAGDHVVSRFVGAPAILRLYQFVCSNVPDREIAFYCRPRTLAFSLLPSAFPLTAWDFPLSLAAMMEQAQLEKQGLIEIHNRKHQVTEDYIAKCEAEAAAKQTAAPDATITGTP